jgi:hypothetical protein
VLPKPDKLIRYRQISPSSGPELLPNCGARLFTTNLESFPQTVFATIGSLDQPDGVEPDLEMFIKRRFKWTKPLDVPQFTDMPN